MAALTGTKTETVAMALNTALAKHVPDTLGYNTRQYMGRGIGSKNRVKIRQGLRLD